MQYMLLLANAPDAWESGETIEDGEVYKDWAAYTRAVHECPSLAQARSIAGRRRARRIQPRRRSLRTGDRTSRVIAVGQLGGCVTNGQPRNEGDATKLSRPSKRPRSCSWGVTPTCSAARTTCSKTGSS